MLRESEHERALVQPVRYGASTPLVHRLWDLAQSASGLCCDSRFRCHRPLPFASPRFPKVLQYSQGAGCGECGECTAEVGIMEAPEHVRVLELVNKLET